MIQFTLSIPFSEFDSDLVEKIKFLLTSQENEDAEVVIRIKSKKKTRPSALRKESKDQYLSRLTQSLEENRNAKEVVIFNSIDEFDDFAKQPQPSYAKDSI